MSAGVGAGRQRSAAVGSGRRGVGARVQARDRCTLRRGARALSRVPPTYYGDAPLLYVTVFVYKLNVTHVFRSGDTINIV